MVFGLFSLSTLIPLQVATEVILEKTISREDPRFNCENATMTLGRDENVYLATNAKPGYVLRVSLDGKKRLGAEVLDALLNATANSVGVIATANVHFNHSVNIYEKDFKPRSLLKEFLVNDKVGWDAPARIEAGASDDFYALDQHRNRVLRINTIGKIMKILSIPDVIKPISFHVSEAAQALYLLMKDGTLHSVGFDGQIRWTLKITTLFSIQDDGTVFYLKKNKLKRISSEGRELTDIDVTFDDMTKFPVTSMAIYHDDLIIKRQHPTELFQIYNIKNGKLKSSVLSAHENISAIMPNLIWTSGETIPLLVKSNEPLRWHVWASTFGTTEWRELEFKDAHLKVPSDFAGIYQIRIGPILNPNAQSEYLLREIVEVRKPQSRGTLSVWTPLNRVHWGRGESIPIGVELRNGMTNSEITTNLSLISSDALIKKTVVWDQQIKFETGKKIVSTTIPTEITEKLTPGQYRVHSESRYLTCVDQIIKIGMPIDVASPFLVTKYGDYLNSNSVANAWEFSDVAQEMLDRSKRLNINQYVDRIFAAKFPLKFSDSADGKVMLESLQKRLGSSFEGVSPHKADFGFAQAHVLGAFSAAGIREMLLLVGMDAALPIGTSTNYSKGLKPEEYADLIKKYTIALKTFPAFHGWDWVANWWVTDSNLCFINQAEKIIYETALKEANETGRWNSILDKVGDYVLGWQVDAQAAFNKVLSVIDLKFSTASSGPYRRPEVYPPVSFSNINEVDLHYQAEQITTPNWTAHAVDFYKRPGKPAWIHPEVWNDTGTGEQILPMTLLALMRGVNGIGVIEKMQSENEGVVDSRSALLGMASVFRALTSLTSIYGPWLKNLTNSDQIAIPVSSRMVKLAQFSEGGMGGIYFTRLYEAYQTCLYAHMPATFIFTEDNPDLSRFKALLIVGQRYEPEPALFKLFTDAQKKGLQIFADGSNRESIVHNFKPLDISFNNIEKLNGFNNDMAFWDFPQVFIKLAPMLAQKLAPFVNSIATVDQPEVLLSEKQNGKARFVWLVNNTHSPLAPEVLWRVQPGISTIHPLVVHVKLNVKVNEVIYDVFNKKEIASEFDADLRYFPARLYAIFPSKEDLVKLDTPKDLSPPVKLFGPHVKDIAISKNGTTALLNTFDWGQNLYGIDLATGRVLWTNKIGDYFAYGPTVWGNGFVTQGYDFNSAQGYHLYSIDLKGSIKQRFAIPGIPARLSNWAFGSVLNDSTHSFAVSPDGSWIAASGNQASAVWNKNGKFWWKEDWSQVSRKKQILLPLGNQTLLSTEGINLLAKNAKSGKVKWILPLAGNGEIQNLTASADARTVLATSTQNKKVFIVRNGQLKAALPFVANSLALASNGTLIAATSGKQISVYSDMAKPLWIFSADSDLGKLCLSVDEKLLAASSELGTLYILDVATGRSILERDMGALSALAWLSNGDLLSATWMGLVSRITIEGFEKWRIQLADIKENVAISSSLKENKISTVQLSCCTNSKSQLPPMKKNLLNSNEVYISLLSGTKVLPLQNSITHLFDDEIPLAQKKPWISWENINMIDSDWRGSFSFVIDTMKTKLHVDEISFIEDANHPESWLRDGKLEYWDPTEERWIFGQYLISNTAVHSHELTKPLEASKFRIILPDSPGWPVGNLRFEKIAFYGKVL